MVNYTVCGTAVDDLTKGFEVDRRPYHAQARLHSCGTAAGVGLGNLLCKLSGRTINPMIGAAGVSAVPMAARVVQTVGQKENPANFLLMHAMGPNVAGVIGTAVAAGVFISLLQ